MRKILWIIPISALKAVDSRNAEALSDAGGEIDAACESCHVAFCYPNEGKQ
jgi:cytochrome c556